mgnify:CR=1 FL=1
MQKFPSSGGVPRRGGVVCAYARRQYMLQRFHDRIKVAHHILGGNMDHLQPETDQKGISLRIVFHLVVMAPTIDLDDRSLIGTEEIHDEIADDLLAIKVESHELASLEAVPE